MKKRILIIIYSFVVVISGLIIVLQSPINLYWQQTYHQDSPLHALKSTPALAWGARQHAAMETNKKNIDKQLIHFDKKSLLTVNHLWFNQPLPMSPLASVAQAAIPKSFIEARALLPKKQNSFMLKAKDKVLFIGDSLMQGVAPHAKQQLYKQYHIESIDLSKQSTGLSYPSFFNWPKMVENTLQNHADIRLIVVYMGPNDPWDFPNVSNKSYLKFKSPEWEKQYSERIRSIIASAQKYHARILWLGAPTMKLEKLNNSMSYLNQLYQYENENNHELYIPTHELLGSTNNQFVNFIQQNGANIKVRVDDGVHFTPAGQKIIANKIMSLIHLDNTDLSESQPENLLCKKEDYHHAIQKP